MVSRRLLYVGLVALLAVGSSATSAQSNAAACWGQASAVFAQMGLMGEHASSFETPRLGLRNLARALFDAGVIADDSMQALGAFVVADLDLVVDACRSD